MSASQWASAAAFSLLALQWVWHGGVSPPVHVAAWAMALAFSLPILPAIALSLMSHRHAPFWGAIAALGYFGHGVMESWVSPEHRLLGLTQALFATVLIIAASWNGLRARLLKPRT